MIEIFATKNFCNQKFGHKFAWYIKTKRARILFKPVKFVKNGISNVSLNIQIVPKFLITDRIFCQQYIFYQKLKFFVKNPNFSRESIFTHIFPNFFFKSYLQSYLIWCKIKILVKTIVKYLRSLR